MRAKNFRVSVAPTIEPVTTAEAKVNSRIDQATEDSYIAGLIQTAREHCEDVSYWSFITRTLVAKLDHWPYDNEIQLLCPPLQSVTSIVYVDNANVSHTYDSSNYVVDTHNIPGRIVLKFNARWPSEVLQVGGAITITYVAGFGDAAINVPAKYKQAIMAYVGAYFENREAIASQPGLTLVSLPFVEAWLMADRAY